MSEFEAIKRKFSNNRKWSEFVAALHVSVAYPCARTYPKVIEALRSGRDWFSAAPSVADANKYCTEWRVEIPPA